MRKIKVLSVFGTRPEAIKMCPLVKCLEKDGDIESLVCITAQHREMLDSALEIFGVKADYDLDLMKRSQPLPELTSRIVEGVCGAIEKTNPDIVLVHGDTTTAFASALAAFYCKVPVGHVEAGLRTYDKYSPFPEEMNRSLVSRIAEYHFSPTEMNAANLHKEGISDNVFITGNTVIDSFSYTVKDNYKFSDNTLSNLPIEDRKNIVITAHRRENHGKGIENICYAVKKLANDHPDYRFIWPVHPNPVVKDSVYSILSNVNGVYLCEPFEVTDMHNLMSRSYLFLSDSGGVQEEADQGQKAVSSYLPDLCCSQRQSLGPQA